MERRSTKRVRSSSEDDERPRQRVKTKSSAAKDPRFAKFSSALLQAAAEESDLEEDLSRDGAAQQLEGAKSTNSGSMMSRRSDGMERGGAAASSDSESDRAEEEVSEDEDASADDEDREEDEDEGDDEEDDEEGDGNEEKHLSGQDGLGDPHEVAVLPQTSQS